MKLTSSSPFGRGGSSVLIVLVLLSAMAAVLIANSITLHWLREEIRRVEQRQTKQDGPGPNH